MEAAYIYYIRGGGGGRLSAGCLSRHFANEHLLCGQGVVGQPLCVDIGHLELEETAPP